MNAPAEIVFDAVSEGEFFALIAEGAAILQRLDESSPTFWADFRRGREILALIGDGQSSSPNGHDDAELDRRGSVVADYVDEVISGRGTAPRLPVGPIGADAAARMRAATGLDVDDSTEVIIASNALHAMKRHPDLTRQDWLSLPQVTNRFDDVAIGRPDADPKVTRLIVRRMKADDIGYGAVLVYASGGSRGKRLSVLTFFKDTSSALDAWWRKNKGSALAGVPDLTEPASNAPRPQAKPSPSSLAPVAPDGKAELATHPAQKEPWQMTRSEWAAERERVTPDTAQSRWTRGSASQAIAKMERLLWLLYGIGDKERAILKQAQKGEIVLSSEEVDDLMERINTNDPHRFVIEKALAEGKPVPPEVLADYPDLLSDALDSTTIPAIDTFHLIAEGARLFAGLDEDAPGFFVDLDRLRERLMMPDMMSGQLHSENSMYSEELAALAGDIQPVDMGETHNRARDEVVEKGRASGREHGVAVLHDGTAVSFGGEYEHRLDVPRLDAPEGSVVIHHNHSKGDSLSRADLRTLLERPEIGRVDAHGHGGLWACCTRVGAAVDLQTAFILIHDAVSRADALMTNAVRRGVISPEVTRTGLWLVVATLLLEKQGVIRYAINTESVLALAQAVIDEGDRP